MERPHHTLHPPLKNTLLIKFTSLKSSSEDDTLKLLIRAGLHPPRGGRRTYEEQRHPHKLTILTATLQLDLPVSDLLHRLFIGITTIEGGRAPLQLQIIPEQDLYQMCLTPKNHND